MDVIVQLEEGLEHSPLLAHVHSVPSPLSAEWPSRDVVTLYGVPSPEALALALAAALEGRRGEVPTPGAMRHVAIWPERGAVGDTAWRDRATGQLMSQDVDIPLDRLRATAGELLSECGQLLRPLLAGLAMPDWPEGARRALNFTLGPVAALPGGLSGDRLLDLVREADGAGYDAEED